MPSQAKPKKSIKEQNYVGSQNRHEKMLHIWPTNGRRRDAS